MVLNEWVHVQTSCNMIIIIQMFHLHSKNGLVLWYRRLQVKNIQVSCLLPLVNALSRFEYPSFTIRTNIFKVQHICYTSYDNWQLVHTNAGPFCTLGRKAVSTFSIAIQPAFFACIAKSVDLFCMTTFWEVLS